MRYERVVLLGLVTMVWLIAGVVAAIALWGSESKASHLSPVPSFHVDIGSSSDPTSTGNSYVEDPNGDGEASDQLMSVPTPLTSSDRRHVGDFTIASQRRIVTDIVIKNADELLGADVRINFDPSLIQFVSADVAPFTAASSGTGFTGQQVGLINLPVEPFSGGTHRSAFPVLNSDNTNGAAFLAGVYLGPKLFKFSSESGPSVDGATNSLPNRNAGQAPNGGVFVRINWDLQPASDGQDVLIDLTTSGPSFTGGGTIAAGSGFTTLVTESPAPTGTQEVVTIGSSDLFDGVVSVNKAIPDSCPPVGTRTDVPNADRANAGGWTNDSSTLCAADSVSTTCSSRIDEDIDTADDADFIQSARNPSNAAVDFELSDAPNNLQTLTDVDVRFRASKAGGRTAAVSVELRKSDGTLLGSPTTEVLSATETEFSYSISGLSLTAADVDGLFVRVIGNVSGGGSPTTVLVQTINVDKTFERR